MSLPHPAMNWTPHIARAWEKSERARAIAADALPRVIARRDYAADNIHAAAFRRSEELDIVRRIVAARKTKRRRT